MRPTAGGAHAGRGNPARSSVRVTYSELSTIQERTIRDHSQVLFICTGNYYRSRFAEALFNHHARQRGLQWGAFSRGMALFLPQGAISPHVVAGLAQRGVDLSSTAPSPTPLTIADLEQADLRIALYEPEHRPMMKRYFPEWEAKIIYWYVPDLGEMEPEQGMAVMEA